MSNMREVARKANVSIATVSRVVNKNGYVSEETRLLVENVISELNYIPNEVARSLFRKSSKTIGIMLYTLKNEFFNEIISNMEEMIFRHGYQTLICTIGEDPERELDYLTMFSTNKIGGLIICTDMTPLGINNLPDVPIVALERILKDSIPSIDCDNVMGGSLAAEKLISLGCKRVLQFEGPSHLSFAQERSNGFADSISKQKDIKMHCKELDFNKFTEAEIIDFLKTHPDVDGIFAASDKIAASVLQCLKSIGKSVPEDVKLIGFDNISITKFTDPPLSTIAQPVHELSEMATNVLFKLINNEPIENLHQIIPVKLIERESTK